MGEKFSAFVQTGTGAHSIGTGSFPEVKRPGRDVDQTPHLAPRLKKKNRDILLLPFRDFSGRLHGGHFAFSLYLAPKPKLKC